MFFTLTWIVFSSSGYEIDFISLMFKFGFGPTYVPLPPPLELEPGDGVGVGVVGVDMENVVLDDAEFSAESVVYKFNVKSASADTENVVFSEQFIVVFEISSLAPGITL